MKTLCLLLSIIWYTTPAQSQSITHSGTIDSTTLLKKKRVYVDQYIYRHQKDLLLYAKVNGKKNLIKVKNENWPEEPEYCYNVLKNSTGRVIVAAQMPYSQSGDWYIQYRHYFDDNGNLYAFSKTETVFDDSVKGGLAMEILVRYYDRHFNVISQTYRLTDKDEKLLKRKKQEFDFREYHYRIYPNVADCLKAYNIKL